MKKSNIILIGEFAFIIIMLVILSISFKPEYAVNTDRRNISDTFNVVSIESENLMPEQIHFSHALDKKDTYIYYEENKQKRMFFNSYDNQDTLFVKMEKLEMDGLYMHLKGVEEVYLNGEKIDIDNIEE